MKLMKLYEEIVSVGDEIYYHGTDSWHEFKSHGYLARGSFFSKDVEVARVYGDFVYKVVLKKGLKIFDVLNRQDAQDLVDGFDLVDTYYDEDEEEYSITTADQLMNSSDSWNIIENTDGVLAYLQRNYSGVRIIEGGAEDNILLFSPIIEKLQSIEKLS